MAVIKGFINSPLRICALFILIALFNLSPMGVKFAKGDDYFLAQSYLHAFSNNLAVFSEVFAINKEVSLDTTTYAKYTVDIIAPGLFGEGGDEDEGGGGGGTTSGASAIGDAEFRHEVTAGISHNFADLIGAELYYDASWESDYKSTTPTVTLKKELFNKNTTLSFGYSRNMDEISGKYIGGTEERTTDNYYLGFTQVLSPVTIMQLGFSHMRSSGFMPEGIRLVPVDGATAASCIDESPTCLDEVFPGSRERNAVIFGVNHYFNKNVIKLTLRYYYDDWDIDSYTAEVVQHIPFLENNVLKLNYRFYTQDKASFFKDNYLSTDALRSVSPQHRGFNTHLVGTKLSHKFNNSGQDGASGLGSIDLKYEFYIETTDVSAHIIMASFKFAF